MKKITFSLLSVLLLTGGILSLGEVTTRLVMGKRLIIAPLEEDGFYRFLPNQEGWYLYNVRASARINNLGIRGPDVDLNDLRTAKKYLFLGDSFTFGYGIGDDETIPHHFQVLAGLKPDEVLNLGNSAFGIPHMMSAYRHYEHLFGPGDTVVMTMIEDDFYRPLALFQRSWARDLFWEIKKHSSFIAWTWTASETFVGTGIRRLQLLAGSANAKPAYKYDLPIFEEEGPELVAFRNQLLRNQQKIIFVFYEYDRSHYSEQARAFCQRHRLDCFTQVYEIMEPLKKEGIKLQTYDNNHPSSAANRALADALLKVVQK